MMFRINCLIGKARRATGVMAALPMLMILPNWAITAAAQPHYPPSCVYNKEALKRELMAPGRSKAWGTGGQRFRITRILRVHTGVLNARCYIVVNVIGNRTCRNRCLFAITYAKGRFDVGNIWYGKYDFLRFFHSKPKRCRSLIVWDYAFKKTRVLQFGAPRCI